MSDSRIRALLEDMRVPNFSNREEVPRNQKIDRIIDLIVQNEPPNFQTNSQLAYALDSLLTKGKGLDTDFRKRLQLVLSKFIKEQEVESDSPNFIDLEKVPIETKYGKIMKAWRDNRDLNKLDAGAESRAKIIEVFKNTLGSKDYYFKSDEENNNVSILKLGCNVLKVSYTNAGQSLGTFSYVNLVFGKDRSSIFEVQHMVNQVANLS